MRRSTTAMLALPALALTGCGPTTYDDALALREDIIDAGVECPGTDQRVVPAEDGTAYLECDNGIMAMAVTGSEEELEELLNAREGSGPDITSVLHAANWAIYSRTEAPLQQLQDELGGTIISGS